MPSCNFLQRIEPSSSINCKCAAAESSSRLCDSKKKSGADSPAEFAHSLGRSVHHDRQVFIFFG
jgi:hypothetical protein